MALVTPSRRKKRERGLMLHVIYFAAALLV
jgi:hypothetical protein